VKYGFVSVLDAYSLVDSQLQRLKQQESTVLQSIRVANERAKNQAQAQAQAQAEAEAEAPQAADSFATSFDPNEVKDGLKQAQQVRAQLLRLSEDGVRPECRDLDQEVQAASRGTASDCEEALKLYKLNGADCSDDLGFGPLFDLCPVTCGECASPKSLLAQIESLEAQVSVALSSLAGVRKSYAGSTAAASLLQDPQREIKRLVDEVKDRHQRGQLFWPLIESFASMQESATRFLQQFQQQFE